MAPQLAAALLLTASLAATADSNINPERNDAWGANIGWLDWRADATNGVEVNQFICSGYIYGANVGWISVGDGSPANGLAYRNDSAADFGLNVNSSGQVSGLAYGANIGWINFNMGQPRIDFFTGRLSGFAYGANVGWMSLADTNFSVAVDSIAAGPDRDGDGIPDSWELIQAGDLVILSANGDADGDGQTDLEEYLADTDPLNPNDFLALLDVSTSQDGLSSILTWTSKPSRMYLVEFRPGFASTNLWQDTSLGLQQPDPGPTTTRVVPAQGTSGFYRIRTVRPLSASP